MRSDLLPIGRQFPYRQRLSRQTREALVSRDTRRAPSTSNASGSIIHGRDGMTTHRDDACVLHFLPSLHHLSYVKRDIMPRIPAIDHSRLVTAGKELALRIPREAGYSALMPW